MPPLFTAVISGNLPSMKNQRRLVSNRRTGKPMFIKSAEALQYADVFRAQISTKLPKAPITIPLSLRVRVLYRSRRNDLDVSYLMDLLQAVGVIENDRQIVHIDAFKDYDKENPRVVFSLYDAEDVTGSTRYKQ